MQPRAEMPIEMYKMRTLFLTLCDESGTTVTFDLNKAIYSDKNRFLLAHSQTTL